ncbi:cytochrome c biogenesis protein ResB [Caldimonas sp. KR1-144]|uniref:cytochrome c biogenesis protein ResB n=1 Tax=Caldimonas sp. KR1-144 TaxID=3400911 RepID=UPI003C0C8CD3
MSAVTTSGIVVSSRSRALREAVEVVSSMRFAIALLSVICIASVIGTVVRQGEPFPNYVNQFGPFWARVFDAAGLYTVYSTWWFLLILAFLVISTSLCIARNLPKINHDLRTFKEHLRASSLKAFHHRAHGELAMGRDAAIARVDALLKAGGWAARAQTRAPAEGHAGGVMVAARQGTANKLGYLCAHSAIVLVCIGGLLDGNLVVRAQMALTGKLPYRGSGAISSVPPEHVLSAANPTYRGNVFVAEGQRTGTAVIQLGDGIVLQPLPFDIELKKFIVDYYDTGMPKLFASEVLIHDHETGKTTPATIKVNEPAIVHGVAVYQSSFDDGGSKLTLKSWPLAPGAPAAELQGEVGASQPLALPDGMATLELTGLRVINVENLAAASGSGATDVRKVDLVQSLESHLGSGARTRTEKTLTNVGPSISYKLRDAAGQAREFNNYMLPIELDGQRVFLAGVRDNPNEGFRYLRIPADETGGLDGWMRLRAALGDPAAREEAVRRYVKLAAPTDRPELAQQLAISAQRALSLFAGAEPAKSGAQPAGGLQAIADFLDANVPQADRARTSDVLIRILNGSLFELVNLARERAGLKALATDDTTQAFMTQAVISLSDAMLYPAPVLLMPTGFDQRQASVFQVTRSPGKNLVYLGCALLIVGVFAMLYIRERRLWIWLEDAGEGRTQVTTALSCTRQTLDTDREFEQWKQALLDQDAATATANPAARKDAP